MRKDTAEKASKILGDILLLEEHTAMHPISKPVIEIRQGGWTFLTINKEDNNPHYEALISGLKEKREKEIKALYKELEDLKDE